MLIINVRKMLVKIFFQAIFTADYCNQVQILLDMSTYDYCFPDNFSVFSNHLPILAMTIPFGTDCVQSYVTVQIEQ